MLEYNEDNLDWQTYDDELALMLCVIINNTMMNYHIDYLWDKEDSEVRYTITDDSGAHVYDESVIGEFDSIADVEMTGYEMAKSRGYWPATYERMPQKEFFAAIGKKGGKKTAKKGKKHFSEIGKKGAEKRWKSKYAAVDDIG